MTKETLETELIQLRETELNKFCPLIKSVCRIDCASFYAGNVITYETYKDKFTLSKPCCTNMFVSGGLSIDGSII